MRVIVHDLDVAYEAGLRQKCDELIRADGRYAPCQGCFSCWTKSPAQCYIKDSLHQACRRLGRADELIIITENLYGGYSVNIKNVLDRSIGSSTPFSTYRGRQMHHCLRYGRRQLLKVIVYGEISEQEKASFTYLAQRNAINDGFSESQVFFWDGSSELEAAL